MWLRILKTCLRHPAFFFFNLAFIINLVRWDRILKEQKAVRQGWGDTSLELALKTRWKLVVAASILGAASITLMVL